MAKGLRVVCGRCLQGFNAYDDISEMKGGRLVTICPKCGQVEGHDFEHKFTFDYNAGDGEHGVKPHIKDEDAYDWEWLSYNDSNLDEGVSMNDYDQDIELIKCNLGLED